MVIKEGYKQTEIGVIPNDWDVKTLGECLIKNPDYGINAAAVNYNDNLPTYLRITDISEDGKYISSNKASVNNIQSNSYYLEDGDIVFARTGASVGKTYLYNKNDGMLVFAGFLIRAKSNPKILNSKYLLFTTQTKNYWSWVLANSMRSGQPGLNSNEYKSFQIPLPPTIGEQIAIASALSDTDALITGLEKLIVKKRNIKQGAMQQLLQPKEDWEMTKFGEICDVIGGGTPSTFIPEYWNGTINWFTPTEIGKHKYTYGSRRKITKEGFINSSGKILPIGAVLLTTRAGIGDVSILMNEGCTNQGFQSLIAKKGYNNEYIYYLITTLKNVLIQNASGSTFLEISPNKIKQIEISISNYEEQTRIATILSDMDAELTALEQKLEKYKNIKLGMMQELLTGKTRLV
jgi:type I restriction enzyme S subunit